MPVAYSYTAASEVHPSVRLDEPSIFALLHILSAVKAPVHYSNVMLVDPVSKKPVRTIFRYLPDGTKVRLSLSKDAAGHIIPIPQQKDELEGKYGLCE